MRFFIQTFCLTSLFTLAVLSPMAQPPKTTPPTPPSPVIKPGPKPYKEVITDKAISRKGFLTVHKVEEKYFLELPETMLGRDLLVINRVAKSSVQTQKDMFGYAGDQVGQVVVRFEKGPNQKIFLKTVSYDVRSDSTGPLYQSVANNNLQPIAVAFEIKAMVPDSLGGGTVIDFTDNISSDNELFGLSSFGKYSFQVGSQQADKSYITSVRPYAANIEIKTVKTFTKTGNSSANIMVRGLPPLAPGQTNITLEVNSSIYLLPERPMKARYEDSRVGYISRRYTDFDANPQGVKEQNIIVRWRLEPKPQDMERYKQGELVEPTKQIVFYIDPATPKKWIPYLIAGVNDWNSAFEKAGFKNAISGKLAPTKEEDSTWTLEDARFSAIVYKASEIENAYGPNVHDPRSGEIIESHIGWFHNIQKLLRNWYFIQAAAVDPKARNMVLSDSLMGQLVRFACAHEVGHTLGLPHNFGSSSTVPVENLRNKAWVEANGHTPSIMDYARFNYVAQPEDNIGPAGMMPRIGDYDKWAIEWGYRYLPDAATAADEVPVLDKWTSDKLKEKKYWYGEQVAMPDDPRCQSEDIGDNAMKASTYGIKNLQRILPNLPVWTKSPTGEYDLLEDMYSEVIGQFRRYIGHVCVNFGGIYETPKKAVQPGAVFEYVGKATQKEALDFISKQVFTTPTWVINREVSEKTGAVPANTIMQLQDAALGRMLNSGIMIKMLQAEALNGIQAYTVSEFVSDLKQSVFTELLAKKPITIFRRNLQKSYIERLGTLLAPSGGGTMVMSGNTLLVNVTGTGGITDKKSDLLSILKGHARELKALADAAALVPTDAITKYHLQDISDRLGRMLNPK